MDTDRTKGTTVSKKRNFLLAGLTAVVGFIATVGVKTAANKRKQTTPNSPSDPLPREEAHSGVASAKKASQESPVGKTVDEDPSDSAKGPATTDSHVDHRNHPRPGAL